MYKYRPTASPTPGSDLCSREPALGVVLSPRNRTDTAIASLGKETPRISCSVTKRNEVLCKDKEQLLKSLVRVGTKGMCALMTRTPAQAWQGSLVLPPRSGAQLRKAWCWWLSVPNTCGGDERESHSCLKGATNLVGRSVQSGVSIPEVKLSGGELPARGR